MSQSIAPLLLAAFLGAPADGPECCAKKAAPPRLVTATFAVMDLVTPIPDFSPPALPPAVARPVVTAPPLPARVHGMVLPRPVALIHSPAPAPPTPMPARPARECRADQLMKLVTGMVRPYSWDEHGGPGKVSFYEVGGAMVVTNSPEVVAEVQELLNALRSLQDASVAVECRLLTVPAGFGRKNVFGDCRGEHDANTIAFLTAGQVDDLMHGVQQTHGACVTQTPKVSLFNGQTVEVSCGDEVVRTFTTGLDVRSDGDQPVFVPRQQAERLGTVLGLQATLAADRRMVRLAFELRQTELDGPVELVPVKHMVTPIYEGGSQGVPVPVTQLLQHPKIIRRKAKRVVTLPDGGTVAVPLGGRKADQEVIALLTARVIQQTEPECDAMPCRVAPVESPAANLVAEYHRACAEGQTEAAMRLAMQALAADPTCFTVK
jgi:hypothetical protein